jgi:hypothetical protein
MTPDEAVDELLATPPSLHMGGTECWPLEQQALRWLADVVRPEWRTIETGCGISSVVFMLRGSEHTMISPNVDEHHRARQWCAERGFSTDCATSIIDDSTIVLPALDGQYDLALIDGGHAFPVPFIDWLYLARKLPIDGLLVVDDIQLPTCGILHEFLVAERSTWSLVCQFGQTSVFRKIGDRLIPWTDWTGQPWVLAEIQGRNTLGAKVHRVIDDPRRVWPLVKDPRRVARAFAASRRRG